LSCSRDSGFNLEEVIRSRPSDGDYLFDYAKILDDLEEYTERYLSNIRESYRIEPVIVSLPSLGETRTIEDTATDILSNWGIGNDLGGRGLLLVLAEREKDVKLEVSYELEDVFTDAFCGYIADLQLKPYFLEGQLGAGLLAVMEEIEQRAQIKHQADYSPRDIEASDQKMLSGGAGARRDLSKFQKEEVSDVGWRYPPGRTPEQAWQTLIQSWQDKVRDPNLGVYTEVGKLIRRDFKNLPDSHFEKSYRAYHNKRFEMIQKGQYAAIFFGDKKGWENTPFLFCETPEGWRFDLVHQRRYVRPGPSPDWGVERADHPYMDVLSRCPYYEGQDIPLPPEDLYRVEEDQETAERIREVEAAYANHPDSFKNAMALGRLYVITSMGNRRFTFIKKAKLLNPVDSRPHKYLAIALVDATYQYGAASREMREYTKREPDDVFGHNYLGYLYFCLKKYPEAIREFEKALRLDPDNLYACCKLSRCYGKLFLEVSEDDPGREEYRKQAIERFHMAKSRSSPDARRIGWLKNWLKRNGLAR
jgi:tetratricopeptide (TPR) repeat protein